MSRSSFKSPGAALRQEAAALIAEANVLDAAAVEAERDAREAAKPKEPDLSDGPMFVGFSKYMNGRLYTYAAVGWCYTQRDVNAGRIAAMFRNTGRWSITGQEAERYNWAGLLTFIGEANWPTLATLVHDKHLIKPEDAPPVVERMGRFGRVLSSDVPTGGDPRRRIWEGQFSPGTGSSGGYDR